MNAGEDALQVRDNLLHLHFALRFVLVHPSLHELLKQLLQLFVCLGFKLPTT